MRERRNTIFCTFDHKSPWISAFSIFEWIYNQLPENDVTTEQMDGQKRHVYIKSVDFNRTQDVLRSSNGQTEYRHDNGEISLVRIELPGMGTRGVRIANLPPEVPEGLMRTVLSRYGEVKEIEVSKSREYRYCVANGIRIAVTVLANHIHSHMTIAGNRLLVSYEGQTITCYGCNDVGHLYQLCPYRSIMRDTAPTELNTSWADIVARGSAGQRLDTDERKKTSIGDEA